MRSALISAAAWTVAIALVCWQRLLKPALLAAFPAADSLWLESSQGKSHESRPSDPLGAESTPARPAPTPRRARKVRTARPHPIAA
jgi:hypothetical protein